MLATKLALNGQEDLDRQQAAKKSGTVRQATCWNCFDIQHDILKASDSIPTSLSGRSRHRVGLLCFIAADQPVAVGVNPGEMFR
jgi:hypothetical protein